MATATEDGRKKWADGLQKDIGEIIEHLEKAFIIAREVEPHAQGVNGLPGFLRGQGNAMDVMLQAFRSELDDIPKKLYGERPKEPIAERVAHPEMVEVLSVTQAANDE